MGEFARPFRGTAAIASGALTSHQLRHGFTRIFRDVYVPADVEITARIRALAAWQFAGPDAVLVGRSSAAMHGTRWIDASAPAEVVRPGHFHAPQGLVSREYRLEPFEIYRSKGVRFTTGARTAFDLGRALRGDEAIVLIDALCNATGLKVDAVADVADRHRGAPGVVDLRAVLDLVDGGAESPPESRTRLALVRSGLPRPETQIVIEDEAGFFVARADLGWRRWRVLVEYQGEQHWTNRRQRARDLERRVAVESLGWTTVEVGAELLDDRPEELVRRVAHKLTAAGCNDPAVTALASRRPSQ